MTFLRINGAMDMSFSGLHDRIINHQGMPYQRLLFSYDHSKNILSGNSFELQMFIDTLEKGTLEKKLGYEQFRKQFRTFDGHLVRYFHNFISAVKTLVDHTRVMMANPLITAEHRASYTAQIESHFKAASVAKFVHDFRNYIVHCGIPHTIHTTEFEPQERTRVYIDLQPLLNWDRWSPSSREYMEARRPRLRILDLVQEYERLAIEFHRWFVLEFNKHYGQFLIELETLQREWNRGLLK